MIRLFLAILSILVILPPQANAQDFTDAQKKQINQMIKNYITNNGDTILEGVNKYQAKLQEQDRKEAEENAKTFLDSLKNRTDLPMAGNPDGDITMVEFFDYNCGYCRKALEEIKTVLKDDKNLKVIFMDMPILGPSSMEAAKWSLAANKQGKYFEYHQAIMNHNGPKNDESLEKLAKKIGLDIKKLKKDKDSDGIAETLNNNVAQAQTIGIRGTPGFIIAGEVSPGFIPASRIKNIIEEARNK